MLLPLLVLHADGSGLGVHHSYVKTYDDQLLSLESIPPTVLHLFTLIAP